MRHFLSLVDQIFELRLSPPLLGLLSSLHLNDLLFLDLESGFFLLN